MFGPNTGIQVFSFLVELPPPDRQIAGYPAGNHIPLDCLMHYTFVQLQLYVWVLLDKYSR
ncbi:hypothetical protein J15TS10_04830 [Paenibacillus woosongensis]|uniref:Uncharacterized protein n=1 Tax=Paenibacillus woosongensis TaxID=307580 RepID=A0ABQ4ML49_9BACL|nr:hypothetical protein J15TS10_04830 [Paenibacillus woosongensis]